MVTEDDLETPALVVDVARLDRNIERWQRYADAAGLVSRPHAKTHKCIEIARRQLAAGAIGITCQKLGEAEVMAAAGFDDILVPYNPIGPRKVERLAALLRRVRLAVAIDDPVVLPTLAAAAAKGGRDIDVLVECDTGYERAGVPSPDDAAALGAAADRMPGLRFNGFLTYPSPPATLSLLRAAVARARELGLESTVVSGGGTPGMWQASGLTPTVTEYRVGTYVFFDRNSIAAEAAALDDVALTILATVVSRPAADRAILDAGSKTLTSDLGPAPGHGLILEAPSSTIVRLSEEHGHVAIGPSDGLHVGDRVHVVPNHVCPTVNLADELWARHADGSLERWPVAARGRSS